MHANGTIKWINTYILVFAFITYTADDSLAKYGVLKNCSIAISVSNMYVSWDRLPNHYCVTSMVPHEWAMEFTQTSHPLAILHRGLLHFPLHHFPSLGHSSVVQLHTFCRYYSKSSSNNGCQSQPPLLVVFKWARVTSPITYDSWNKSSLSIGFCKHKCPVVSIILWLTVHGIFLSI